MSSTIDPYFDPRVAEWLEADPDHAPAQVLATVLAAAPSIPQRGPSSRLRTAALPLQLLAAGIAIVLVTLGGLFVLRSVGFFAPTPAPSSTHGPFPPPAATYTSAINGFSIGYPAGQRIQPATRPIPPAANHSWQPNDPWLDDFLDTVGTGSLSITAVPIPAATTPEQWVADELAASLLSGTGFPACAATMTTEPVTVDGVTGIIDTHCASSDLSATLTTAGIAYAIDMRADPPDKAWFLRVLGTMKLHPEAVVQAKPAPSSDLVPFTSPAYGYSVSYPSNWKAHAGSGSLDRTFYPYDYSAGVDYFSTTSPDVSDPGLIIAGPTVDAATTTASWAADIAQLQATAMGCGPADLSQDIDIGGESGKLQTWNACPSYILWAGVVHGGRAYHLIWIDQDATGILAQQTADGLLFQRILSTFTFATGPPGSSSPAP